MGQFVTTGTNLGITFGIESVEVRLPISIPELDYLELPDPLHPDRTDKLNVTLSTVVGESKKSWQGKIVRTEAVLDKKSRVLYVVARVAHPYLRGPDGWDAPLRIGTFVDAVIEGKLLEDVVVVPRSSLRPGNQVWIIDEEQQLRMQDIDVVRADEKSLYVSSGVSDGQLICITSLENPLPGTQVQYTLVDTPAQQAAINE